MNPILTIALLLMLLAAVLLLPQVGLLARLRVWSAERAREQMEDALKHLLDREHAGRRASADSLAGALDLRRPAILRLIASMETQGLLETRDRDLHLTAEGERWALHVVRAHRLWERYLADEARLPLRQVHTEAHRREHTLTEAELDELDAALGHPSTDPHGDPIPTREGHLPGDPGKPLTDWPSDAPGRISHLEDEPAIAYAQILAEGLRLGQTVRVLDHTPERFLLSDGEREYRLAPAVAANVFLSPLPETAAGIPGALPLYDLRHGQSAEIVALDEACQGFTRRRFLDLGLTPGAQIQPELQNFFGDPRAYRVRGTLIALRHDQAAQIWVRPSE